MEITPRSELDLRIGGLQDALAAAGIDGALVMQNADLFYFSGTIQQSHLYIPADPTVRPLLMVRKSLARARQESELDSDRIVPLASVRQLTELLADHLPPHARPVRIGFELDVLPVNTFAVYQQVFAEHELVDCSVLIRRQRAVKSDYELNLLRRAALASRAIYQAIPELLHENMSELALAAAVEAVARQAGHQGVVRMRTWNNELFYGHLMGGASAAVPSYMATPTGGPGLNPSIAQGAGTGSIRPNEPLLVDYVFAPDGYLVDQTRIFAIGELPADLVRAHQAMLTIQQLVMEAARPGVTGDQLWQLASRTATELGFGEHFMGAGSDRVRFVGHGIGLELDELPVLAARQSMPLEAGMVVALEPKVIFPGRGVVGIENSHVVTKNGLECLTTLPDEIVYI